MKAEKPEKQQLLIADIPILLKEEPDKSFDELSIKNAGESGQSPEYFNSISLSLKQEEEEKGNSICALHFFDC